MSVKFPGSLGFRQGGAIPTDRSPTGLPGFENSESDVDGARGSRVGIGQVSDFAVNQVDGCFQNFAEGPLVRANLKDVVQSALRPRVVARNPWPFGRDTWHARIGVADEVQDFPAGDPYANPRRR
jgi:hypothetical protein